jgi:O-antigen/teichoic acid export membrane protein
MSLLQAQLRLRAFNALRLLVPVAYFAGTVLLALAGRLTVGRVIVLLLGSNCVTLVATLSVLPTRGTGPLRIDTTLLRGMLRFGSQAQIGDVSHGLNLRLDQTLMAAWLPAQQLGLYVAAISAANPLQGIAVAMRMVITPRLARAPESVRVKVLCTAFRQYWLASLACVVALAAILPLAIPIVFGPAFAVAVRPAEVLLLATFLVGAKDVLGGAAQAFGMPWLSSRAELIALGVTVLAMPVLLIRFGIMGAAIASALAYGTELVLLVRGLHRRFRVPPRDLFLVGLREARLLVSELPGLFPRTARRASSAQAREKYVP